MKLATSRTNCATCFSSFASSSIWPTKMTMTTFSTFCSSFRSLRHCRFLRLLFCCWLLLFQIKIFIFKEKEKHWGSEGIGNMSKKDWIRKRSGRGVDSSSNTSSIHARESKLKNTKQNVVLKSITSSNSSSWSNQIMCGRHDSAIEKERNDKHRAEMGFEVKTNICSFFWLVLSWYHKCETE